MVRLLCVGVVACPLLEVFCVGALVIPIAGKLTEAFDVVKMAAVVRPSVFTG